MLRRSSFRAAAMMTVVGVLGFGLAVFPAPFSEEPAAAAEGTDCSTLDPGETCEFRYADYPSGAQMMISTQVPLITVLATGGAGAPGEDEGSGPGGAGALVITEIPMTQWNAALVMTLGAAATDRNGGVGWSRGGEGGYSVEGSDGGGGGGSTAVTFYDPDEGGGQLIVAGGGGGGGGCIESGAFSDTCNGGGAGGAGGNPPQDGSPGTGWDSEANGSGGVGGGSGTRNGEDGEGFPGDVLAVSGGGGGGGGWLEGGGGGGKDGEVSCSGFWTPQCHEEMPGAAGGGGGGTSMSGDPTTWSTIGEAGDGSVVVIAGSPEEYGCVPAGDNPRIHEIQAGVEEYVVIGAAGAGSRGHNGSGSQGKGGVVTGTLDVMGLSELALWVGCSPYTNDGAGFGHGGEGGDAPDWDDMDGGDGGAATMIAVPESTPGRYVPLMAAGGGGGSGGDECIIINSGCNRGGHGGNGGGVDGTANSDHGGDGPTDPFGINPGRGGCGACVPGEHGGHGSSSGHDSGAGGGGGAGYPYSGHGGGVSTAASGGGGGAGGSFLSPHRVRNGSIGTDDSFGDGFILLIALDIPKTSLTVTKAVAGSAASYGTGPFTVSATCERDGVGVGGGEVQLGPAGSHTFTGLPVGARCTIEETGTGGASTPAETRVVTLTPAPTTVTMTNVFGATSIRVTVASVIGGADDDHGVSFSLPDVLVPLSCRFDGEIIGLPVPAAAGFLRFNGNATLAPGGSTLTVTGVPIGASCVLESISPATDGYTVDGLPATAPVTFTTGTAPSVIGVSDLYPLAPLEVTKTVEGEGPPGYAFGFEVACTYRGEPVTLGTGGNEITVTAGSTGEFPYLPVGADCGVIETSTGTATSVSFAPSSHVTIGPAGSSMQVTNSYSAEPLTVTVSNSGPGAAWANTETTVGVVCSIAGVELAPLPPLVFAAAGGSRVVDVDEGAVCEIGSVSAAGQVATRYASSADPAWSTAPVAVTVAPGAGLRVDNAFDAAPVEVTSMNSGAGSRYANAPTAASVGDCTFNGLPAGSSTQLTFGPNGGAGVIPAIVVGARCRVTQTIGGGATTVGYTVINSGTGDATGADIDVTAPATAVVIDNVFDLGALSVTNTVTGAAAWASNTEFTVAVTCTFNGQPIGALGPAGTAAVQFEPDGTPIPSGGFAALSSLPLNASCASSETENGGATAVEYIPSATVPVVPGSALDIVNRFDATGFSVQATVSGNDSVSHEDDTFPFAQSCTFNDQLIASPQTTPAWSAAPVLAANQTIAYTGLPVGADCEVSEVGSNHATAVLPAPDQGASLGTTLTAFVFQNVFDVGSVTLTQDVNGPGAATYGLDQTFLDDMVCVYGDGTGVHVTLPSDGIFELSATGGWSTTFAVPVGATCSVRQLSRFMATTVVMPAPIEVILGDNDMVITSTYDLDIIEVSNTAIGLQNPAVEFGFAAACTWHQTIPIPLNQPGDSMFTLRSGETAQLEALVGAGCSVAEVDSAGAIRVDVSALGSAASVSGVTASAYLRSGVPVDFAFVNFMQGSLPVTGAEWRAVGIAALILIVVGGGLIALRGARGRQT